jgi:predicted dithiol-disulfide oxidoreductase (DUF899 family)
MATPAVESLPRVVSSSEWIEARKSLLAKEKEMTRARDRLNAERRRLPMVLVDKDYTFTGPNGPVKLLDLFEGRQQLIVHHLMFHPDWDAPCVGCASTADPIGELRLLHTRNTTLVGVSRAPYEKLAKFKERIGWKFPWYSSSNSDFNYDFHVTLDNRVTPVMVNLSKEEELKKEDKWDDSKNDSEIPALSAFLRVDDKIYHTYWTSGRGLDVTLLDYKYLDLTALGRQEDWEEPKGRAAALGVHVPEKQLLPDEY